MATKSRATAIDMDGRTLAGKRILVTGAAQGIGHISARFALDRGATVIALDRAGAGLDAAFASIEVTRLALDVTDAAALAASANPPSCAHCAMLCALANGLLLWNMTYEGLSGAAIGAHIHGPATEAQNAGIVIGFNNPVSSPMAGQATLTPAQFADLRDGKWYVNVHTAANRGGEIRGQLKAQ